MSSAARSRQLRSTRLLALLASTMAGCAWAGGGAVDVSGNDWRVGRLAYVELTDGYWQIWELDFSSGQRQQRTFSNTDKRYPRWGDSGRIYFRTNNDGIHLLEPESQVETPLLRAHWPALDPAPRRSDGALAVGRVRKEVTDQSAVVLSLPGENDVVFLTPGERLRVHLRWGADGQSLLYTASFGPQRSEIRRVGVDDPSPKTVIAGEYRNITPAESPSGDRIAFASDRSGDFDLYVREGNGRERRLLDTDERSFAPAWSPDGRAIVFTQHEKGSPRLWVVGARGGEAWRLADVPGPAMDADWTR